MLTRTLRNTVMMSSVILASFVMSDACAKSSVWKVSKGDDYVYIGGTVHILPPSEFPLPKEFAQAYGDSDSIVLEAKLPDPNDTAFQMNMMQKMTYSNGSNINDYLSKKTQQQLSQYVAGLGANLAMFEHFKPGFLVTMLAMLEIQKAGLSGEGVDMFYSKQAIQDNKKIEYFETADFQMNMMANMGIGDEDKFIESNLKQMKGFKAMFTDLLIAWRAGDTKQLNRVALEPMQEDPKTLKLMLTDRNKNWITDINKMFADKDREFILVGAAHLVGEQSVLALLKGKGYKVEQL